MPKKAACPKLEITGQSKQDVEPNGEDAKNHEALHQIRISRVELRQGRSFREWIEKNWG